MSRNDGRNPNQLRPLKFESPYYDYAEGSCVVSFGRTRVLCVATVEDFAPPFIKGSGKGWMTAEYSMLPRCSPERIRRERTKVGGRTQEIQRLIGRSLRSVFSMEKWGERSIIVDCDVLEADGGTRTASISGAFVAAVQAFRHMKKQGLVESTAPFPSSDYMAAVSVGIVGGECVLDLDYSEDSTAETDMNLVMTSKGEFIEIQGTAEATPFDKKQFDQMMELGQLGVQEICKAQSKVIGDLIW